MNHLTQTSIYLVACAIIFTCCNPDEPSIDEVANVMINGQTSSMMDVFVEESSVEGLLSFNFEEKNDAGFVSKSLLITFVPMSMTRYKIYSFDDMKGERIPKSSMTTLLGDGHVIGNFYNVLSKDSLDDFIILDSINLKDRFVEGRFTVNYTVDSASISDSTAPTTFDVNCDFFRAVIGK